MGRRTFRYVVGNVENLTGDPVRRGPRTTRTSLDAPRNRVRLEFIARVLQGLDAHGMAIMEMGSDAEDVLRRLCAQLDATSQSGADRKGSGWESTISEEVGALAEPPVYMRIDLSHGPYLGRPDDTLTRLLVLLDYYHLAKLPDPIPVPAARRRKAHVLLARRQNNGALAMLLGEQDDKCIADDRAWQVHLDRLLRLTIPPRASRQFHGHVELESLFDQPSTQALAGASRMVAVVFLLATRAQLELGRRPSARFQTDGPYEALRYFGYNAGRYERYGLVWRTGLHEAYLRHALIRNPLQKLGTPTNTRPSLRFKLPLGSGQYVSMDLLHNMYTPAGDKKTSNTERQKLRSSVLIKQAEENAKLAPSERAMFIASDTNVEQSHVGYLGDQMATHGYDRLAAPRPTTYRQERTIERESVYNPEAALSQPFDAIFQDRTRRRDFPTTVTYLDHEHPVVVEVFHYLMATNGEVRRWYLEILRSAHETVHHHSKPRRSHSQAESDYARRVRLAWDEAEVQVTRASVRSSSGAMDSTGSRSLEHDLRLMLTFADVLRRNRPVPSSTAAGLPQRVHHFVARAHDDASAFQLFYRHFVSDHLLMLLTMEYSGLVQRDRHANRSRTVLPTTDDLAAAQGFEVGVASGRGLSCFLYSLRQLSTGKRDDAHHHAEVTDSRLALSLAGVIPGRGMIEVTRAKVESWLMAHREYQGHAIRIWHVDPRTGDLAMLHTLNARAGRHWNMFLHGNHFVPLWPRAVAAAPSPAPMEVVTVAAAPSPAPSPAPMEVVTVAASPTPATGSGSPPALGGTDAKAS